MADPISNYPAITYQYPTKSLPVTFSAFELDSKALAGQERIPNAPDAHLETRPKEGLSGVKLFMSREGQKPIEVKGSMSFYETDQFTVTKNGENLPLSSTSFSFYLLRSVHEAFSESKRVIGVKFEAIPCVHWLQPDGTTDPAKPVDGVWLAFGLEYGEDESLFERAIRVLSLRKFESAIDLSAKTVDELGLNRSR